MTVATNSYYQKVLLYEALKKTSDSTDALKFQLHDFGYRGSTSVEVSIILNCTNELSLGMLNKIRIQFTYIRYSNLGLKFVHYFYLIKKQCIQ